MGQPSGPAVVLLADDHEDGRRMYAEYLTAIGFRVVEARDGEQAAKLAKRIHPAIVVLDVQMPRLDGISAIQRIRSDGANRNIPILVVTASDDHHQQALKAGASAACVKPCLPDELANQIRNLLRLQA
jgi:DNA-binding response OmpR family regulator